jgi:hypothetical protein
LPYHQYSTLINLGTIQLQQTLAGMMHGEPDSTAKAELRESLDEVEQATAISPAGQFGRDTWQAIWIEHLLAGIDHPNLIEHYDFIGSHIQDNTQGVGGWWPYGSRYHGFPSINVDDDKRIAIRSEIDRIGMDYDWTQIVHPDYPDRMPFDEPTLAIIGMWTQSIGPNPHLSLAIARTMDRIGQKQIAWDAYERTVELMADFWPDPGVRTRMIQTCRDRQQYIASKERVPDPVQWQKDMRARHLAELAWGTAYQKAYQDYEAAQIAAGVPLDRDDFYKAFFDAHPPIASAPGLADDAVINHLHVRDATDFLPMLSIVIGVGILLGLPASAQKRSP